jgi:hypothetical protein
VHLPTAQEIEQPGWKGKADLVIDEWLLLEYACTFLPIQQQAVVDAVSKGELTIPTEMVKAMGLDPEFFRLPAPNKPADDVPTLSSFTPLEEIEKHFIAKINSINVLEIAAKAAQEALDRHRGRV